MVEMLKIRPMCDDDLNSVISLYQAAGLTRAHNEPERDIAFARKSSASEVLVGESDGEITASVMVGHDGHRGVVYYLGVAPGNQQHGFGRQMMRAAESWLKQRGIWKLNLMIRMDNTKVRNFYKAIGYEEEPRLVMAKWLSSDTVI